MPCGSAWAQSTVCCWRSGCDSASAAALIPWATGAITALSSLAPPPSESATGGLEAPVLWKVSKKTCSVEFRPEKRHIRGRCRPARVWITRDSAAEVLPKQRVLCCERPRRLLRHRLYRKGSRGQRESPRRTNQKENRICRRTRSGTLKHGTGLYLPVRGSTASRRGGAGGGVSVGRRSGRARKQCRVCGGRASSGGGRSARVSGTRYAPGGSCFNKRPRYVRVCVGVCARARVCVRACVRACVRRCAGAQHPRDCDDGNAPWTWHATDTRDADTREIA